MNSLSNHQRSLSVSKLKSTSRILNCQFSQPNQLSSSTLMHTHQEHSFPKANRFPSVSREQTPKMVQLGDTKSKRSTSFGFGTKMIKSIDMEKRDKLNPGPGDYEPSKTQSKHSFTFGNRISQITSKGVPGPGHYEIKLNPKTPQFSMYGKIADQQVGLKQSASFVTYHPKDAITQNQRFNKISFGIGERMKQTVNEEVPGPGSYQFKSLFELINERRKMKMFH